MSDEPLPGALISKEDFQNVVRLTPLVSMDFLIRNKEGKMLVGRRLNEPAKGYWFFPGGRITKNETRSVAFTRLTRVELGVEYDITEAKLIGVFDHIYEKNVFEIDGYGKQKKHKQKDFSLVIGTHYVAIGYEFKLKEGNTKFPDSQHNEYLWMSDEELLKRDDVHYNTKNYLLLEGQ